ncbi:glycosyltransferase [Sphingomonas aurantiaca]|uniref:glycosyltransferase n=1 Tax=Sphingomonas aurantiaca TaxID=185949 RepID=UPI002FDF8B09
MHTHLLATRLRARGHDVVLFASTRSDPATGLTAICDETALMATGVAEATDIAFFREHHAYLRLMSELRRGGFDIAHNNSLHYLPVAMADTLPMPMVTTLHTPPFCWLESGIRLCRAEATRFVAVSEAIRAMWSPIVPIDRVVGNGIDLDRFPYRVVPDADPYLVWYGRIVPEKGFISRSPRRSASGFRCGSRVRFPIRPITLRRSHRIWARRFGMSAISITQRCRC